MNVFEQKLHLQNPETVTYYSMSMVKYEFGIVSSFMEIDLYENL